MHCVTTNTPTVEGVICVKSGVKFPFKSWIQAHRRVHLKTKLHRCFAGTCGREYKYPQDLNRHTGCHLKRKFGCAYCDYTSLERRMMKWHQLRHNDVYPFVCNRCPYKCKYNTQWARHLKKCKPIRM